MLVTMKIKVDIIVVDQNTCSNFVKNTDGQVLSILLNVAENGKQSINEVIFLSLSILCCINKHWR